MPELKPEQYEFLRNDYLPKLREEVKAMERLVKAQKAYANELDRYTELMKRELEVTCHESNVGARTGRTA